MWIKRTFTLLFIIGLVSCQTTPEEQFVINGTISNGYDGYIYLQIDDQVDSTMVEDNKFTFAGHVPRVIEAGISNGKAASVSTYYFGNEEVSITLQHEDGYFYGKQESKTMGLIDSVMTYLGGLMEDNPNPNQELYGFMESLIKTYPDHAFVTEIVTELIGEANYLTVAQSETLLSLADEESIVPDYLESARVAIERMKNLKIGDPFPDFTLTNADGKEIKPSDFKGKYLLVDMWASWCGPCRKANPMIGAIYQEYQAKGFEALSISVDTSEAAWKKATDKDNIVWPNARVEGGLNNEIAEQLGIVFLPFNYLIDPKGNVVKINVQLTDVLSTLESQLGGTP